MKIAKEQDSSQEVATSILVEVFFLFAMYLINQFDNQSFTNEYKKMNWLILSSIFFFYLNQHTFHAHKNVNQMIDNDKGIW